MKFMKIAVAAVFAFAYGNAYAFHSGGVAECEGCHSMHNCFEGSANVTGMAPVPARARTSSRRRTSRARASTATAPAPR